MPFDRKPVLPRVTLVLGGARSGKSRYAEALIEDSAEHALYLATAEPLDEEMRRRIALHRARRGPRWTTLEEPAEIAGVLRRAAGGRPILVECLTLWLSNLLARGRDIDAARADLLAATAACAAPIVFVANEVGLGIVPENALARAFRDHAGALNRELAAAAQHAVFIAAGLPLVLKDKRA